jgi:N-acetylglucosamine repressor
MTLLHSIIKNIINIPMSLAEIQSATQASLPTVRRAVKELTENHWLRVIGQAETTGGRPAMLFGIDERYFVVVGLQLQLPGIRLIVTDLFGRILEKTDYFQEMVPEPSEVTRAVTEFVVNYRAAHPQRQILGIGIAAPGFIDLDTGDIITIGRVSGWDNFPICQHLSAATGIAVQIANDVDCMAITEVKNNHESFDNNMAYVGFYEGVKVSLFLKGELYKGAIGNIGLISSELINVSHHKNPEEIKRLLTIAGINEVFAQRVNQLDASAQKKYQALLAPKSQRERFRRIMNDATHTASLSHTLIQDLIDIISIAVANGVYFIQPDILLVGGLLSAMPKPLFSELETAIRSHIPPLINNNLIIKQSGMESKSSAAIGAIHHFLQNNLPALLDGPGRL